MFIYQMLPKRILFNINAINNKHRPIYRCFSRCGDGRSPYLEALHLRPPTEHRHPLFWDVKKTGRPDEGPTLGGGRALRPNRSRSRSDTHVTGNRSCSHPRRAAVLKPENHLGGFEPKLAKHQAVHAAVSATGGNHARGGLRKRPGLQIPRSKENSKAKMMRAINCRKASVVEGTV